MAVCYKQGALLSAQESSEMEQGGCGETSLSVANGYTIARNSWCYTETSKNSRNCCKNLVDVVAKMAIFCSILGPRQTLSWQDQDILTEIEDWLAVNGEAIYQSRPLAGVIRRTIRGPGGVRFSDGQRHYTSQFPLYHA